MKPLFLLIFMIPLLFQNSETETYEPVVVLELFTSQGCSSCPRADEILKNVKQAEDHSKVITLSYHVDYWNYIGWKDPFSKKAYTEKQQVYGQKFYSNRIYTPQMVVNGREHFVGSKSGVLQEKLAAYLKGETTNAIKISNSEIKNGKVNFTYHVEGDIADKQLRFVLVINERITNVKRGENRNRTINNSNIVITELRKAISKSGETALLIPELVEETDQLRVVALVETKNLDIIAGAQVEL